MKCLYCDCAMYFDLSERFTLLKITPACQVALLVKKCRSCRLSNITAWDIAQVSMKRVRLQIQSEKPQVSSARCTAMLNQFVQNIVYHQMFIPYGCPVWFSPDTRTPRRRKAREAKVGTELEKVVEKKGLPRGRPPRALQLRSQVDPLSAQFREIFTKSQYLTEPGGAQGSEVFVDFTGEPGGDRSSVEAQGEEERFYIPSISYKVIARSRRQFFELGKCSRLICSSYIPGREHCFTSFPWLPERESLAMEMGFWHRCVFCSKLVRSDWRKDRITVAVLGRRVAQSLTERIIVKSNLAFGEDDKLWLFTVKNKFLPPGIKNEREFIYYECNTMESLKKIEATKILFRRSFGELQMFEAAYVLNYVESSFARVVKMCFLMERCNDVKRRIALAVDREKCEEKEKERVDIEDEEDVLSE